MEEDNKRLNNLAIMVYALCAISLSLIILGIGQIISATL